MRNINIHLKRNLRILQQIQEKRASLLGSRGQAGLPQTQSFEQGNHERLTEVTVELSSKSLDYSLPPPRYFTPVDRAHANDNDVSHHLVKPTPRHVGVVRPVQYPDRKICHPVPQAMRHPRGSSPADITDSRRLPPKKRPFIPAQEDVGPSSTKVGRMAIIDYDETSAFYKYIPARVIDDYIRYMRHTVVGMTAEDREEGRNTNNNAVQNKLSGFMRQLTTDLVEDNTELDMEVAEIFHTTSGFKVEYCQSPNEPWIPQVTDDIKAADERKNLDKIDKNNSFIQQISPIIISLSPSISHCNQTTPENSSDMNSNFIQQISPVIVSPSPGHSPCNQSNLETFSATIRHSSCNRESTEENPAYSQPHSDLISYHSTFPGSEADSPGKQKPSMAELRRMVLDRSADRPELDRFTQTEEEQFAEILEDFLEENNDLPPEIRDNILDMLTKTRETVAEQKDSILYTAEIYKGGSDDKPTMDEFDRAADDEIMEVINELDLPDLKTELPDLQAGLPDLPTAVSSESPKDALLDMEASMKGFDRAADDEVIDLINQIELPDMPAAETSESGNDVLLEMDTHFRESMAKPTDGIVYSTDVFIGADDERLLAEFERVVNDVLTFEYPSVHYINESSKAMFNSINCVEVEMDSTGQEIYDEIAAFFGYDGYHDYLYSADDALPDLPYEYSADTEYPDQATDDSTCEYLEDEESDRDDLLFE